MGVITVASSKGGPGKSTACALMVGEIAKQGRAANRRVALIDTDPNQHSGDWGRLACKAEDGSTSNITVIDGVTDDNIFDVVDEANKTYDFVFIDLEGVADQTAVYAVGLSDFVVIMVQGSEIDAKEAVKTIKMVKRAEKSTNKKIGYSLLFTRLPPAFNTKLYRHIRSKLESAGVAMFDGGLIEREPYKNIFSFNTTLNNLPTETASDRDSVSKAKSNIESVVKELKMKLYNSIKPVETQQVEQKVASHA